MAQLYYSPVTVNTGQVPSTQTDFPVLISYTDARFKTTGNGGHVANANGYDIRAYSDSGLATALTYELERYNASTGEVIMWVKRSSLADGNVTYLGYGDTSLTTDGSSTATWSNSFLGVYHLGNGTTINANSSTGSNNGTNSGSGVATAGKIDGAVSWSVDGNIGLGNGMNPAALTYSAWVKPVSFPGSYNAVISRSNGSTIYTSFRVKNTGKLACYVVASADVHYDGTGSHTLVAGTYYYLTMTYSSSAGLIGYVNASSDGTAAANGTLNTTATNSKIAEDGASTTNRWDGIIDEARVSSVARSANWITTEYNNQNAPSTFATLGTEVSLVATRPGWFVFF